MASQEKGKAMEGLLRRSFARESAAEACPDAAILAAYFERSLAADETAQCELHFSQCALCRERLAAMASIGEEQAAASPAGEKAGQRGWRLGFIWGWHWLAPAAVVMSLLLVWFIRYRVQTRTNAHPWTAPMVAIMKQEPNPATAANQPLATRGKLAVSQSAVEPKLMPRLKKAAPAANPALPNLMAADEARAEQALKNEKDQKVAGGAAGGAFAPAPSARGTAAAGADATSATSAAQPSASLAMNYAPPPPAPKRVEQGQPAHQLDKVVAGKLEAPAQNSGQGSSQGSGQATGQGATGSASAGAAPPPVEPATTQSVTVMSASPPLAATDKIPAATSSPAERTIGAQARLADGTVPNSTAITVEANKPQKTVEAKRVKAAAQADQAGKENHQNGRTVKELNAPSAGQSTLGTGYVVIATPDPAVFWRIAPDGFAEHSTDTGATWEATQISAQGPLLAGSAPKRNVCWMVGRDGLILVTDDAHRWKQVEPPVRMDIVGVSATSGFAATIKLADGARYETNDRGKKWRALP